MKMRHYLVSGIILALAFFLLVSCQPQSEPIEYGVDICHHCKMTIVDKKFAAQAVTDKGKVYNFDAIECLVPFIDEQADTKFEIVEVNSYLNSKQRLNARQAFYVKSPEIPSPMGGYLSAYADQAAAKSKANHPDAIVMDWMTLQKNLLQDKSN